MGMSGTAPKSLPRPIEPSSFASECKAHLERTTIAYNAAISACGRGIDASWGWGWAGKMGWGRGGWGGDPKPEAKRGPGP